MRMTFVELLAIVVMMFWLSVVGTAVYVALHFIAKYW